MCRPSSCGLHDEVLKLYCYTVIYIPVWDLFILFSMILSITKTGNNNLYFHLPQMQKYSSANILTSKVFI